MTLKELCPHCNKPLVLINELVLNNETIKSFKCGHTFVIPTLAKPLEPELNLTSVDQSKKARPYQVDGIKFILNSGFAAVVADQMRLGKTPQSLLALKNSNRFPCLILVRSANLFQWIFEYQTWVSTLPLGIWPIQGSKSFIPKGFSSYIISMDTFSREGMVEKLLAFGFKLVILDEAHSMKNPSSKRSQALVQFLSEISKAEVTYTFNMVCPLCKHQWEKSITKVETKESIRVSTSDYCPKCSTYVATTAHKERINIERKCGIIMLTGTPIKNRAEEYFVPLNIIAPDRFPNLATFRRQWLEQDSNGKWNHINRYRHEDFRKAIAPFVIRREKEDVYTDIPKLNRMFSMIEITDQKLKDAYNKQLDRIEREIAISSYKYFSTIAELTILRQICGLAKIDYCVDYVEELIEDSEKLKLAIGIHHHGVRDSLAFRLSNYGVLKLSGEDSAERKYHIMTSFENSPEQILVLNMLAGGIGMDFHYIDKILVLERQWSSADEEQFEFRFFNPDKSIKNRPTDAEYFIAKGTVDEFFYDLVEDKRKIFGEAVGTNWDLSQDADSFKDLVIRTLNSRL